MVASTIDTSEPLVRDGLPTIPSTLLSRINTDPTGNASTPTLLCLAPNKLFSDTTSRVMLDVVGSYRSKLDVDV